MIRTLKQTMEAGSTWVINFHAETFRLLETSGAVTVRFYQNGAEVGAADDMEAGFSADGQHFDKITVYSSTAQSVKFSLSDGGMKYDRMAGTVSVSNLGAASGAFVNEAKTVTNVSGQMIAANAARRFLMVQNNDAAGNIYVRLDGGAATVGTGVKIAPGASLILDIYAPTGAVMAIGDIANNANIVTVGG